MFDFQAEIQSDVILHGITQIWPSKVHVEAVTVLLVTLSLISVILAGPLSGMRPLRPQVPTCSQLLRPFW